MARTDPSAAQIVGDDPITVHSDSGQDAALSLFQWRSQRLAPCRRAPAILRRPHLAIRRHPRPAECHHGRGYRRQLLLGRLRRDPEFWTGTVTLTVLTTMSLAHRGMFPCLRLGTPARFELAS